MKSQRQNDAAIKKQLKTVADQLSGVRSKGSKRLALLRKQAQLGDERDASAERERRAEQDR